MTFLDKDLFVLFFLTFSNICSTMTSQKENNLLPEERTVEYFVVAWELFFPFLQMFFVIIVLFSLPIFLFFSRKKHTKNKVFWPTAWTQLLFFKYGLVGLHRTRPRGYQCNFSILIFDRSTKLGSSRIRKNMIYMRSLLWTS